MRESSSLRLEKADRLIVSATRDLEAGKPGFAVDRAYYAMIHAAEASHRAGIRVQQPWRGSRCLRERVAKSGEIDVTVYRWLHDAFGARQKSIYDPISEIDEETTRRMVERADEFLSAARTYLESPSDDG